MRGVASTCRELDRCRRRAFVAAVVDAAVGRARRGLRCGERLRRRQCVPLAGSAVLARRRRSVERIGHAVSVELAQHCEGDGVRRGVCAVVLRERRTDHFKPIEVVRYLHRLRHFRVDRRHFFIFRERGERRPRDVQQRRQT